MARAEQQPTGGTQTWRPWGRAGGPPRDGGRSGGRDAASPDGVAMLHPAAIAQRPKPPRHAPPATPARVVWAGTPWGARTPLDSRSAGSLPQAGGRPAARFAVKPPQHSLVAPPRTPPPIVPAPSTRRDAHCGDDTRRTCTAAAAADAAATAAAATAAATASAAVQQPLPLRTKNGDGACAECKISMVPL